LYPAWWIGKQSAVRRAFALSLGVVVAGIVILGGSRTLWLALALSTAVVGAVSAAHNPRLRLTRRRAVTIGIPIGIVVLVAIGVGGRTLIERATDLESVGWRTAMWGSLIHSWLAHPLFGSGPGSFPWLLQGTGYFDTNSFGPRHPDSAPIQLLAEGGLAGLAAVVVLLIAFAPAVARGRSTAAAWALLTFAFATLASNPTDFAFLLAVGIGWLAFAAPRIDNKASSPRPRVKRSLRLASLVGGSLILMAWLATTVGSLVYREARQAVSQGDMAAAQSALTQAHGLDPGLALYTRQLGILALLRGDDAAAGGYLLEATRRNPQDDVARRALALVDRANGRLGRSEEALRAALSARRSDPTNLLLTALVAHEANRSNNTFDLVSEAVQAWPQIVLSESWASYSAELGFATDEVIQAAFDRWKSGKPAPELLSDQGIWLEVMAEAGPIDERAVATSDMSPKLAMAMAELLSCQPPEGLRHATQSDIQSPIYWRLAARADAISNRADRAARDRKIVELMARRSIADLAGPLNPLRENALRGTSTDLWGYRRVSIDWPSEGFTLPSPNDGLAVWLEGRDCAG
jgi:tetratricopeptide (TPR) repeat protein